MGAKSKVLTHFRPVVRAREGFMLGIRQPLDGPIFEKLEHAQYWCWHAMLDHYERGLGMADAEIHPFNGLVDDWGPPSKLAHQRDINRICDEFGART